MSQSSDGEPGSKRPRDAGDLAGRLDRLNEKLKRADLDKAGEAAETRSSGSNSTAMALALRVGSEFIAAIIVGGAIGWGVDSLAGSAPWGMIVFLMLGFAAGVLNVLRSAGLMRMPGQ